MLKFINIIVALTVLIAVWFLFFEYSPDPLKEVKKVNELKQTIPISPAGWTSVELELGPTEEAKRSAEKILGANEYLNREYRSPDGRISFVAYSAYWEKGTANGRVVVDHTPDKCWVLNGWKNDKSKARSDLVFEFDGIKLIPAFYRRMTFDNLSGTVVRYVCFWHIMDGKRYDYGDSATFYNSFTFEYLYASMVSTFKGAPEQYFIRLDSAVDFSVLKNERAFQEVVKAFAKIALEQKDKETK